MSHLFPILSPTLPPLHAYWHSWSKARSRCRGERTTKRESNSVSDVQLGGWRSSSHWEQKSYNFVLPIKVWLQKLYQFVRFCLRLSVGLNVPLCVQWVSTSFVIKWLDLGQTTWAHHNLKQLSQARTRKASPNSAYLHPYL